MPKMKSHSGAKKRFRVTGSGRIKSEGARRTTPRKMSNSQRRVARNGKIITGGFEYRIKRMLIIA
jgi:large subunit ribosomal protein L35